MSKPRKAVNRGDKLFQLTKAEARVLELSEKYSINFIATKLNQSTVNIRNVKRVAIEKERLRLAVMKEDKPEQKTSKFITQKRAKGRSFQVEYPKIDDTDI